MRLIPVLLLLAGCVSPQERQAQLEAQRAAYLANLQRQCAALGYQHGTQPYSDCMLQLHQGEQQRRAAIGAAILSRPPAPVYQAPAPVFQSPTTTNCYRTGDFVNCTTR